MKKFWYQNVIFVVYPEGARELTGLRLKEIDLRFIDEDQALQLLFPPELPIGLPDWKAVDIPGKEQTFNHRW